MSTYYRGAIVKKIVTSLFGRSQVPLDINHGNLRKVISLVESSKKYGCADPQIKICIADINSQNIPLDIECLKTNIQQAKEIDVESLTEDRKFLYVKVKTHKFNQHILRTIQHQRALYGYVGEDGGVTSKQHYVVEYSSPNIAKPFHAGHLRSTLLGSFISNLYESVGHSVTRINYLGDWGTQFGLLLTGYHRYGDSEKLDADPLLHLLEVYVKINKDVETEKAAGQSRTYSEALATFTQLEEGNADILNLWKKFRNISLTEYKEIYQRLGVHFTETHTESMYRDDARELISRLKGDNLLHTDESGVGCVEWTKSNKKHKVTLVKADGSTMYITRDLAAAIDRFNKYKFDRMHYVVDQGQSTHFNNLQTILDMLGHNWTHGSDPHFHVPFGRVYGMSTRRGDVVLLKDILDEAKLRMTQSLLSKETTRTDIDVDSVAETLGISCVVVQDLKERRNNNYTFSWDRALNFKADSGVFLQYCHARLCSVHRRFSEQHLGSIEDCNLSEDIACRLVLHLARYPDAVQDSLDTLEPCFIVNYMFKLGHLINSAYKQLPVMDQSDSTAQARLALFDSSRQTLANGLTLLGITPLEKM